MVRAHIPFSDALEEGESAEFGRERTSHAESGVSERCCSCCGADEEVNGGGGGGRECCVGTATVGGADTERKSDRG